MVGEKEDFDRQKQKRRRNSVYCFIALGHKKLSFNLSKSFPFLEFQQSNLPNIEVLFFILKHYVCVVRIVPVYHHLAECFVVFNAYLFVVYSQFTFHNQCVFLLEYLYFYATERFFVFNINLLPHLLNIFGQKDIKRITFVCFATHYRSRAFRCKIFRQYIYATLWYAKAVVSVFCIKNI